jgi:hypothetical protein
MKKRMGFGIPVFIGLLAVTCDKEDTVMGPKGPVTLEMSPVAYEAIRVMTPLGNVNPPGHTFPTNHIYFYLYGTARVEVRAVADGTVRELYYNSWSDDYRVEFTHTTTFATYFDHVADPPSTVKKGAEIQAGELVGYADPSTGALDLGVVDYEITRQFIDPRRYHEFSLHCGDPYQYFSQDVLDQLLPKNQRTAEPRGGKIDYDVDATLAGNWFLDGTPVGDVLFQNDYSANHLAFVYDMIDPSRIRIAAGGTLQSAPFVWGVTGNAPDPVDVTGASGPVKYALQAHQQTAMLVQLQDARTIRVEVFPGKSPDQVTGFTDSARLYRR